jgi:hypothetical protein
MTLAHASTILSSVSVVVVIDKLLLDVALIRLYVALSQVQIANIRLPSISDICLKAAGEPLQH